ncbi:hypothetical protein Sme01_05630 [Sphaerisporangium melleum]|uniref:Ada DNA repair metal-binding domain-containing protein n=1 Tax=Sphaerisporangium melleum TaxID=321316 RepID=A0A917QR44_9ACTN|nr:hypothetical protein [Sphaerisporangium melleum]GGK63451.1 hypothetical protein GCM10007964_03200 [Sphaerisporangium melleum]GII68087.1 hypothetical protein Sme01_05630 [Sphaerisporangium melleum]
MSELIATGAGDAYHLTEECWGLRAGQSGGEAQGYTLHGTVRFATHGQAEAAGFRPCGICFPGGGTPQRP